MGTVSGWIMRLGVITVQIHSYSMEIVQLEKANVSIDDDGDDDDPLAAPAFASCQGRVWQPLGYVSWKNEPNHPNAANSPNKAAGPILNYFRILGMNTDANVINTKTQYSQLTQKRHLNRVNQSKL